MIQSESVTNDGELVRLGNVTRARVTQIMNFLRLAPEIQEESLFLPAIATGRAANHLRQLQKPAGELSWDAQQRMWFSR